MTTPTVLLIHSGGFTSRQWRKLAAILVPILLLGGERSPMTERRVIENLGAALPRATVRFFPGVGHMGPISHASLVNEAIVAHLQVEI